MELKPYSVNPIGLIHSCYPEKFGIPKQPGLVQAATGVLEFYPEYAREEMVKGLDQFSHIWIIFLFHKTLREGWKPTVRPPRLGGRKRVGVFASRSPHRPNHFGMSAVRLEAVRQVGGSVWLELSGVDLLDGTPVVDIKPYIPYSDSIADAACGYTGEAAAEIDTVFTQEADAFCRAYQLQTGRDLHGLIVETLRYDPRPASQRSAKREFGVLLWDVNVRWRADESGFEVITCSRLTEK